MDVPTRLDEILGILRKQGCRVTPQRVAIVKTLIGDRTHPTVDEVYTRVSAEFPMTSMATVYKTVALLREVGQLQDVGLPGGTTHLDGAVATAHPHLVCTACGRIVDVQVPYELLREICKEVEAASGCQVETRAVTLSGLCPDCCGAQR